MPSGTLPINGYLGDGQRTTSEFQGGIDELLAYVNSLKAEVDALSTQVIREAATRAVGTSAGNVPDKAVLDTRLGTTGNLGTAAQEDIFSDGGSVASYEEDQVTVTSGDFSGDFSSGLTMKFKKVGNIVNLTVDAEATHALDSVAQTGVAAIPEDYRPANYCTNVYLYNSISVYMVTLDSDGRVTFDYRTWSGGSYNNNNTGALSITYAV